MGPHFATPKRRTFTSIQAIAASLRAFAPVCARKLPRLRLFFGHFCKYVFYEMSQAQYRSRKDDATDDVAYPVHAA